MFLRIYFSQASVKCGNLCVFYVVFMWCFIVWFLLFCLPLFVPLLGLVLFFQNNQTPFLKTSFWLIVFIIMVFVGVLFGLYFVILVCLVIMYHLLFLFGCTKGINVQQFVFGLFKCVVIIFIGCGVGVCCFLG